MARVVPIENIYYLLCYAWNTLDESDVIDTNSIESPQLQDLFARILINGTNRILKDGLDKGYYVQSEASSCLRGRLDFCTSTNQLLLQKAQVYCCYDELQSNILHNQILKTTIKRLSTVDILDSQLRVALQRLYHRLVGIDDISLSRLTFRQVQLHRNNSFYSFLMNLCELIFQSLLVDETSGSYKFRDFMQDPQKMWKVFQSFVFNFYRFEQSTYKVSSENIGWDIQEIDDVAYSLLPRMVTDITLKSDSRTLIIDTKYYEQTLQSYFDTDKFHSKDMYQLFTYLMNYRSTHPEQQPHGMLLYPCVTKSLNAKMTISGVPIQICTIDLSQPWLNIKTDLLGFVHALNE